MRKRFLIFLIILGLGFGIILFWYKNSLSAVDNKDNTPIMFIIPKGQSVKEIAGNLKKEELIKDQIAFFTYVRLSGLAPKIQAGNYRLNRSMDTIQIANELTIGKTDEWVTIIEGWRVEEIAAKLGQSLGIPESEFLKFTQEGYLFPDTYLIPKDATAKEVIDMILANFRNKVTSEVIEKGKIQGLTLDQIITLASIIEREVKSDNDRVIVAGILLKRLRNGWPLQTDATIQYALGYQAEEKTWWKKKLTSEDLAIDSPYNTYKNIDLPPGPITSPGLATIKAVVEPQKTSYWYYLSDKKGITHFAATQEEHKQNIDQYLR